MPVRLPPGLARLAARPCSTGVPTLANTIGIAVVAPFAAMVGGLAAAGDNHVDSAGNQLGGHAWKPIKIPVCPAVFDGHVLALSIAVLAQALAKRGDKGASRTGRPAVQEADHRHRLLLRTGAERPTRSAAEQRNEGAPLHIVPVQLKPSDLSTSDTVAGDRCKPRTRGGHHQPWPGMAALGSGCGRPDAARGGPLPARSRRLLR